MKQILMCIFMLFTCISCSNKDINIETNFNSIFELNVGNSSNDIIGYATCFKLKDIGCVTSSHNIVYKNNNDELTIYNYIAGKIYNSNLIIEFVTKKYSYEDDYAILEPKEEYKEIYNNITSLNFNSSNDFNVSDKCYCIGNLNNYGLSYNEGTISSKLKKVEYHNKENYFIQTNIEISKGVSGCPLFNFNNEVIGIMTFKVRSDMLESISGMSFALPITCIFN